MTDNDEYDMPVFEVRKGTPRRDPRFENPATHPSWPDAQRDAGRELMPGSAVAAPVSEAEAQYNQTVETLANQPQIMALRDLSPEQLPIEVAKLIIATFNARNQT